MSKPIAKYNHKGVLITDSEEMKKMLILEFKERFRTRPERPDLFGLKERKEKIFDILYKKAFEVKCRDFSMSDLEKAMSDLKNKKSHDPQGYINEIFKSDVVGQDFKLSLLYLFNCLKNEIHCPESMRLSNISTVPKGGSKLLLSNLRGINRVTVIPLLYMRLIYNLKY